MQDLQHQKMQVVINNVLTSGKTKYEISTDTIRIIPNINVIW